jgi:hypothetical protein
LYSKLSFSSFYQSSIFVFLLDLCFCDNNPEVRNRLCFLMRLFKELSGIRFAMASKKVLVFVVVENVMTEAKHRILLPRNLSKRGCHP